MYLLRGHAEINSYKNSIAIVGIAGRFPGAKNLTEFWTNLKEGVKSIAFFSDEELTESGIAPLWLDHPNYVKAGGILNQIEYFDASFFGYTRREAEIMDPQHRLLMECTWEALENAGYTTQTYPGKIALYAGSRFSEYFTYNQPKPDMVGFGNESLVTSWKRIIANDKDTLSTNIAYKLNLTGPIVTVQTACSTSLTAVHLASQSLRNGECDMALCGGVCIRIPQKAGYPYTEGMIFSPDGHTRTFDAKAAGTLFSSGLGMVALKRVEDAMRDRDNIHAIIRGSGINNDGAEDKRGFTAPGFQGQTQLIKNVLAQAEIDPESITYVEAHGTATLMGDPVEVAALTDAFRRYTNATEFCAIGFVKTNIGHLVQAAGIAGLIKVTLMLKNKMLTPSLNFHEPNPKINFQETPFYVNTKLMPWESRNGQRRAAVSSFGIGGANAHVILEQAPATNLPDSRILNDHQPTTVRYSGISLPRKQSPDNGPENLLCISAKSSNVLKKLASSYIKYFNEKPSARRLEDICFTASAGRSHFDHRLAMVASSSKKIEQKLASFLDGEEAPGVSSRQLNNGLLPTKIAFLFTGQGSQYIGMGRELYETQSTFRNILDQCDLLLRPQLETSLLDILYNNRSDDDSIYATNYAQPALFVFEYALAQLWKSWGIEPTVVIGHSVGEYAAACFAGVFSLEDGLKLIATRAKLMQTQCKYGRMIAAMASENALAKVLAPYKNNVAIAAVNGPNTILSGYPQAINKLVTDLEKKGIKTKNLRVSHAFHSPMMEPMLKDFEEAAKKVNYASPKIDLISTVTGKPITDDIATPE